MVHQVTVGLNGESSASGIHLSPLRLCLVSLNTMGHTGEIFLLDVGTGILASISWALQAYFALIVEAFLYRLGMVALW